MSLPLLTTNDNMGRKTNSNAAGTHLSITSRGFGTALLVVGAIFATTAMEAPFLTPENPVDDVHIGAPWRWLNISGLWYIAGAWMLCGALLIFSAKRNTHK